MSPPADLEAVETVLSGAIALRDASLVIFRRDALIEFKTEHLEPGLTVSQEGGRRSWQIGPFEGHHCHLNLAAVRGILFDAEPVPCQGGRLNYTVWFLGADDCGNPHRPDGLFSVTLNAPYDAEGVPRTAIIGAVYALHDRCCGLPRVSASPAFQEAKPAPDATGLSWQCSVQSER